MSEEVLSQSERPLARPRRSLDLSPYSQDVGPAGESHAASPNLLLVLWRRRGIVLACVLVAIAAGVAYLARATPIYGASSVIYVQQSVPKIFNEEMTSSANGAGYLSTQCQLIASTAILSGAMEVPGVADAKCLQGIENPVGFLHSIVSATPTKQGDLIMVSVESENADDAAVIANGVVQAYIEYQSKQHQSTALEIVKILQREMDTHEADLKAAQDKMLALRQANPDLALEADRTTTAGSRLSQLSDLLSQAQFRLLDVRTALAQAADAKNDPAKLRRLAEVCQSTEPLPPPVDLQSLAALQDAQGKLDDLRQRLGERNTAVTDAQHQVDRLRAAVDASMQQAAAGYMALMQDTSASIDARIKELQDAIQTERTNAIGMSAALAEYQGLVDEAARNGRALDVIDGRMKEVNVSGDIGSLSVSVLETAKPNNIPVKPRRAQTLGMSLVAGLMGGLGLAYLLEMADQRLRSLDEVAEVLDLPVLGAVPRITRRSLPEERGQEVAIKPRSSVAEAYRTIRTAIYFGMSDDRRARTMLVTSASAGEGKTTSVSNLAIAISQAGRRVLVIDADTRRPSQHKMFRLADGPGLTDVLSGKATIEQAIRATPLDRLDVLPCGTLPHNPAELLDSQAMIDLLGLVQQSYDQVIIDSPPVVPVSDARILAAMCDVTLLILRAESTTRRLAKLAREALTSVGGRIVGVVVNDVPRAGVGYNYAYYGHGRYGVDVARTAPSRDAADANRNGRSNGNVVVSSGNGRPA